MFIVCPVVYGHVDMVQCKNLSDVLISEYWDLLKRASAVHLVGFFF